MKTEGVLRPQQFLSAGKINEWPQATALDNKPSVCALGKGAHRVDTGIPSVLILCPRIKHGLIAMIPKHHLPLPPPHYSMLGYLLCLPHYWLYEALRTYILPFFLLLTS